MSGKSVKKTPEKSEKLESPTLPKAEDVAGKGMG